MTAKNCEIDVGRWVGNKGLAGQPVISAQKLLFLGRWSKRIRPFSDLDNALMALTGSTA